MEYLIKMNDIVKANDRGPSYRKVIKSSNYLASSDLSDPIDLVIVKVTQEIDKNKRTKDFFNTAYFNQSEIRPGERLKPMVLNNFNCKVVARMTGTIHIWEWLSIPVTIYVDPTVKLMGEVVGGLRISPNQPKTRQVITPANKNQWANAIKAFERDGNLNMVLMRVDMSQEHQQIIMGGSQSV